LEELAPDEELRERVKGYIEGEIARSKKEKEEEDEAAGIVPGDRDGADGESKEVAEGDGEGKEEGSTIDGEKVCRRFNPCR
jgi:hypothetical protein